MIDLKVVNDLYSLVCSENFKLFLEYLDKMKYETCLELVNLQDNDNSILTVKRLQGKIQILEYITKTFTKEYFDNVINVINKKSNIGNTV